MFIHFFNLPNENIYVSVCIDTVKHCDCVANTLMPYCSTIINVQLPKPQFPNGE